MASFRSFPCILARLPDSISAIRRGFALILFMGFVSGCAFADVSVRLPTASTNSYSGGQGRFLVIPTFIDQRHVKDRIGMQKNNYGMDTANAVPDQSMDTWITNRLRAELESVGFRVVNKGMDPKATTVQGYILKLFIEPVVQWTTVDLETDFSVRIRVTRPDGLQAERRYFVKGLGQGLMALEGAYAASLNNATEALMKRIVIDIINLLNRFPDTEQAKKGAMP